MADIEKPVDYEKEGKNKGAEFGASDDARKIRITLTSCNVKTLETVCADLLKNAREKKPPIKTKGPVRIPTKTLRITTRKTPCGEGSKTWDHYQMRIHKRVIEVFTQPSIIKEVTKINIGPGVEVVVTLCS